MGGWDVLKRYWTKGSRDAMIDKQGAPVPNRLRDGLGLACPIIGNLCPACRRRTLDPHGTLCGAVDAKADVPAGAGSPSFVVEVVVVVAP